tara:strand:+ start:1712 stop:2626 length:915 start_codon:yes stop_codon:yes gene_type:complete
MNIAHLVNKRILILGKGYVGTAIYNELKLFECAGVDVTVLQQADLDYTDADIMRVYLEYARPHVVISCFGFTGRPNIDEAEDKKDLCWRLNCTAPADINRLCSSMGIGFINISSGCIYSGYGVDFNEKNKPNFGMFDDSSFYSKSKHAYELQAGNYGSTIRLRMPFTPDTNSRNYLMKILGYDNLIEYRNSKTSIPELVRFITYMTCDACFSPDELTDIGIVNFVHPEPLMTSDVLELMKEYGVVNDNWKLVDIDEIDIKAPRSNCVLDTEWLECLGFNMPTEEVALRKALTKIQDERDSFSRG